MKIYNTLTKEKEDLVPREGKQIKMFVCGPTVYDYIHIGNARTFVIFDVVAKYLRHRGYDLTYIQNITDIDNKIIERAQKENSDPLEYAKKYTEIFKANMETLGVTSPEYKNATDHIEEVIHQVQKLLDKDSAYTIDGDGIYFDLSTFSDYGKLSGRTAAMADDAVTRIDDSDKKRNRGDFALWKFKQEGDPSWPAPFGEGRPGWHIEDTAITEKYFGPQYDIHGGGMDLMFPHHEAEIAQQESASGLKPFVKYWMHSGFLINKESKMSKSLGNFLTLHDALEKHSKETLRFYFLSNHYRAPLDLTDQSLNAAEAATERIKELLARLHKIEDTKDNDVLSSLTDATSKKIKEEMDNDFNTPAAFAAIFELIRKSNKALADGEMTLPNAQDIINTFAWVNSIFGIVPIEDSEIPDNIHSLVDQREQARQTKDYDTSDQLRNKLKDLGYEVEDTEYGPLVKKV